MTFEVAEELQDLLNDFKRLKHALKSSMKADLMNTQRRNCLI